MKKKLLFVIPSLAAGGAEKSLVNLLSAIDYEKFDIDLFLFSKKGIFLEQIPNQINVLPHSKIFENFQKPLISSFANFITQGKIKEAIHRVLFTIINRVSTDKAIAEQRSWKYFKTFLETLPNNYDVSIGYVEKTSVYFCVEKTMAERKIAFIHTDYDKLGINPDFENNFFNSINKIVGVSEECATILKNKFPSQISKITFFHNISSPSLIRKLALYDTEKIPSNLILSIGRLQKEKGFDIAVNSAKILKEKNLDFAWWIIGEGSERKFLESLIKNFGLEKQMVLLGLKKNPYPYLRAAKIYVQPSRYEGKSIAVDEAKILCKPIIVTAFQTAKDQIENGITGLISQMDSMSLANEIENLLSNEKLSKKLSYNLTLRDEISETAISKLYNLLME